MVRFYTIKHDINRNLRIVQMCIINLVVKTQKMFQYSRNVLSFLFHKTIKFIGKIVLPTCETKHFVLTMMQDSVEKTRYTGQE